MSRPPTSCSFILLVQFRSENNKRRSSIYSQVTLSHRSTDLFSLSLLRLRLRSGSRYSSVRKYSLPRENGPPPLDSSLEKTFEFRLELSPRHPPRNFLNVPGSLSSPWNNLNRSKGLPWFPCEIEEPIMTQTPPRGSSSPHKPARIR